MYRHISIVQPHSFSHSNIIILNGNNVAVFIWVGIRRSQVHIEFRTGCKKGIIQTNFNNFVLVNLLENKL